MPSSRLNSVGIPEWPKSVRFQVKKRQIVRRFNLKAV